MFPERAVFFLIAGAGKSGTSALADVMAKDPDIAFARNKEPRFFVHQTGFRRNGSPYGPPSDGSYRSGFENYLGLFAFKPNTHAYGEASTAYLYCHETPELIASFNPAARLVFLLRDPVARIVSQYRHEKKVGHILPELTQIIRDDGDILLRYLWGSRYATHLARYLKWFPPKQLLVMEYSEFFTAPEAGYNRVRQFLGLPEYPEDEIGFDRINEAREPASRLLAATLRRSSRIGLGKRLPHGLHSHARKAKAWLTRRVSRPAPPVSVPPAALRQIQARLDGEIAQLCVLFDRHPDMLQGGRFDTSGWQPAASLAEDVHA